MKRIIAILICLISFTTFAADSTSPTDNLYQIDLIVFTHITNKAIQSENWYDMLRKPNLKDSVEPEFTNQPSLQTEASKLKNNSDYQIIFHNSWTQNITNKRNAQWIHIYGGQPYNAKGELIPDDSNEMPTYWQLNGKIKISKATFIDINTKLYLTIPLNKDSQLIPLRTFTLFQNRRMKLNQLNYLDHPLFGVLVKVSHAKSVENEK